MRILLHFSSRRPDEYARKDGEGPPRSQIMSVLKLQAADEKGLVDAMYNAKEDGVDAGFGRV